MKTFFKQISRNKIVMISAVKKLLIDIVLFNFATFSAVLLRFDYHLNPVYLHIDDPFGIIENIIFIVVEILFRIPLQIWEYASVKEVSDVLVVITITKIAAYPFYYLLQPKVTWSRGAYLISYILAFLFIAGVRIIIREIRLFSNGGLSNKGNGHTKNVLIIGAGDAGEKILREILAHPELNYNIVGFLDDNPSKRRGYLHGLPVLGNIESIPRIVRRRKIDVILIAMPSATTAALRRVVSLASKTDAEIKTLPGIWEIIGGRVTVNSIRNVKLEDLLPRSEIVMDNTPVKRYITGKVVLITGAGGSIGSEISRQVSTFSPRLLLLLGRGENRIFYIEKELIEKKNFHNAVPIICDIRNREKVFKIFENYKPEVVFHTAAHKHVPLMEKNPDEAVMNNIFGTKNLLDASIKNGVERFINISTDKAVNPVNVMGASKRIIEMMLKYYSQKSKNTIFTSVRFGNVLGSAGSVIEVFKKQIRETGIITITDPRMERYFMMIPEAVQLVLQAGALGKGGEIFVLKMGEQVNIMELAKLFVKLSGLEIDRDVKVKIIGNRGNEKLSEELWNENEKVLRTTNPYILKLDDSSIPYNEERFFELLEELKSYAAQLDYKKIREEFNKIIPEADLESRIN
jgi:FlaA1/EpsC-like NDP-sugar epimerase